MFFSTHRQIKQLDFLFVPRNVLKNLKLAHPIKSYKTFKIPALTAPGSYVQDKFELFVLEINVLCYKDSKDDFGFAVARSVIDLA